MQAYLFFIRKSYVSIWKRWKMSIRAPQQLSSSCILQIFICKSVYFSRLALIHCNISEKPNSLVCGLNDLLLFLNLRCYYRKHLTGPTLQNSHNVGIMNFSNSGFAHLPRQWLTKLVTTFLLKIQDSEANFRCRPHFFLVELTYDAPYEPTGDE